MFSRASAILSLIRPLNLLIAFLSIIVASVLAGGREDDAVAMALAACAGIAVAAGANAINDRFDVAIDRVNRPDRPIPRGALTERDATLVWGTSAALAAICSATVGPWPFGIVVGSIALLYSYSRSLKAMPLVGNIVVAGMTGLAFIYGASAVGSIQAGVVPALFAFFANLAREVVKDVEDRDGDSRANAATLPVRYGVRPARIVTSVSLTLLIVITLLVAWRGIYQPAFLPIVLVADAIMAFVAMAVWRNDTPAHMRMLSSLLKVAMVVGLVAIWFGRPVN